MADWEEFSLDWLDYTIFIFMLSMSAIIGLYHGIKRRKNNTIEEYLFGGRNVPALPIIMSNMASNISTIALVLIPVETYLYGGQFIFLPVGEFLASLILYYFHLPVFYHLKYTSIFEYLERRFNRTTRLIGSAIYTITQIFYALMIMYSACMAITKAFPIPFYVLTSLVCTVCTIYTVLGGLRGVVWADFLQALFMFGGMVTIIIVSIHNVGGVNKVMKIGKNGGRLNFFNFDLNPFARYSSWNIGLSSLCFATYNSCTNPGIIQRYLSLSSFSKAKKVVLYSGLANAMMALCSVILGLVMYSTYHDCDPLMSKEISNVDQIVPYHVMNLDNKPPGLTGLFLAGILSAALSSLSTMMNSLSGILFDDFVKPALTIEWNNTQINCWIKTIVVMLGLTVTIGIFGLNAVAGGFQLFRTLTSLTGGLIIFIFGFGLFFRIANKKSAIIGAIAGVLVTTWIGIGIQNAVGSGRIKYVTKIISVEGCRKNLTNNLNLTSTIFGTPGINPVIFADDLPYMYRISFNLLMLNGVLVSTIVGLLVSLFTKNNKKVNESLLILQIRKKKTKLTEESLRLNCKDNEKGDVEFNNK